MKNTLNFPRGHVCVIPVCAHVNTQLAGEVRERISPPSPGQQEAPKMFIGPWTLEVRGHLEESIQPQGSPQSSQWGNSEVILGIYNIVYKVLQRSARMFEDTEKGHLGLRKAFWRR